MPASSSYASVILPLALRDSYTYHVPEKLQGSLQPGSRVLVSFGSKRIYTGIIREFLKEAPEGVELKDILDVLDKAPLVTEAQLSLWDWIASYYMCTPGEVMRAALPSGLRPESESRIRYRHDFRDFEQLDPREELLLRVIRNEGECKLGDLQDEDGAMLPPRLIKDLVEKGAVELNEFIKKTTRKKQRNYLRLGTDYRNEREQHELLDSLKRAHRQRALLERALGLLEGHDEIVREDLLKVKQDAPALKLMIGKGIFELIVREESEAMAPDNTGRSGPVLQPLSPAQARADEEIRDALKMRKPVLLQGITSSGKTEIYLHRIADLLKEDKQVLYLLPEIALTTQMIGRVRKVFGNRVGVYHSRHSDSDRVHIYRNLMGLTDDAPYQVLLGARSALFLPFRSLGLIIIDEEHENTYKQQDPAPRYHARDTAQVAALYQDAGVLMGTATPSFESLHNAHIGKYALVELNERFGPSLPPEVEIANTRQARKRKQLRGHFSKELRLAVEETLEAGEQVILFQNRRGYSNYLVCHDCGEIPTCKRCDVSLTYHRISGKLECHYCGYRENMPSSCSSCGSPEMQMKGFGTEKIEEEIAELFPGARVARMDTDTVRSMRSTSRLLNAFAHGDLNILVGTQMLSKGLDFEGVSLVGVLDADALMHFPDFRAFERSYQLIHQVSGRAGRRERKGRVIIQTDDPGHPVIGYLLKQDLMGLYKDQMEERQAFHYPPFTRMIRISLRHKVSSFLDGAADLLARELRETFARRVLGPQYPPVRKTHLYFVKHITLKIEKEASPQKVRQHIRDCIDRSSRGPVFKSVRVTIDVDPN